MKGLLIKDLYLVKGYGTSIILISALFIAIGIMNGSYAFLMLTALYSAMISINTMSYDERGHWDTYADSLPVSRTQVVLSKYILSFIAMLIVWILYLAGQTNRSISTYAVNVTYFVVIMGIYGCIVISGIVQIWHGKGKSTVYAGYNGYFRSERHFPVNQR